MLSSTLVLACSHITADAGYSCILNEPYSPPNPFTHRSHCRSYGCWAGQLDCADHGWSFFWSIQRFHHWCVFYATSLEDRLTSDLPGHVVPEATLGGPIALVEDGDLIAIDAKSRTIDWLVGEEEKVRRRKAWEVSGKSALRERRGILFRYARDVAVRALV